MKIFKRVFLTCLAALSVLAACRKDDTPVEQKVARKIALNSITGVNGPASGAVNQELTFDVTWHNADTTLRFDHISDSAFNTTRIIKLYVKNIPADSLKADTLVNSIRYKFKATTAGTYFLKFFKDNSGKAAIIDTVTIR